MNPIRRAWCRTFQATFRIALPLQLPPLPVSFAGFAILLPPLAVCLAALAVVYPPGKPSLPLGGVLYQSHALIVDPGAVAGRVAAAVTVPVPSPLRRCISS